MKRFGRQFLESEEKETITLIKSIISHSDVTLWTVNDEESEFERDFGDQNILRINIEDIFEILDGKPCLLIELCKYCCTLEAAKGLNSVWRRLLEIYLKQWSETRNLTIENEIIQILKSEELNEKIGLVLCRQFDFHIGPLVSKISVRQMVNQGQPTSIWATKSDGPFEILSFGYISHF